VLPEVERRIAGYCRRSVEIRKAAGPARSPDIQRYADSRNDFEGYRLLDGAVSVATDWELSLWRGRTCSIGSISITILTPSVRLTTCASSPDAGAP